MSEDIKKKVESTFTDSISVKKEIINHNLFDVLIEAGDVISKSIENGGKLLICGNGGSAADAQHLAAEFLIRLTSEVNRESIPAILAQDINSYRMHKWLWFWLYLQKSFYSNVLKRGYPFGVTTSGNSKNILEVLKEERKRGIFTLGFLGNGGGDALTYCDSAFVVPSNVTARIQESHITAGHALLQYVEDKLIVTGWLTKA